MLNREEMARLHAGLPKNVLLVIDSAYAEYVTAKDYEAGIELVTNNDNVVMTRTFSKLYGMAGLRAGAAFGRPDLLSKITPYGAGALPVTGMIGAAASLKVSKTLVPERRELIGKTRTDVQSWLTSKNVGFVPSTSNKIMIDTKRPGQEVIEGMFKEKVLIGRVWPVWPTYVRVSIGTPEEMAKFKTAFSKVMGV